MAFNFLKSKINSTLFLYTSVQVFSNIIRILCGLLIAKIVLPETNGLFNGLGLIIGYLPIMQLGVVNGLNRNLPYLYGKNDLTNAKNIAAVALFWEIILSLFVFIILISLSIYNLSICNYKLFYGYLSYSIVSIHHFLVVNYLNILYRTNNDFKLISKVTILTSITSLFLIILVIQYDFYGLCTRIVIISIIEAIFLWHYRPLKIKPIFNFKIFKEIIKIGIPIFFVGYIYSLWSIIQNTIIYKIGGNEYFGLFSIAIMIESSILVFSNSINQVLYPQLSYLFGQGSSLSNLISILVPQIKKLFFFILIIIIIGWLTIPPMITYFLPNYIKSIDVCKWTILLSITSVFTPLNLLFNVLNKQKHYFISIISGIITYSILIFILIYSYSFQLKYFPQAMLVGKIVQILVATIFINSYLIKKNEDY